MTKQYQDLFKQFSTATHEEQLAKIREVRHRRSIERPASARKRIVRETKKKQSDIGKAKSLMRKLTPEQKADLVAQLKGKNSE